MNFTQAMAEECNLCRQTASNHRMTRNGHLFCLALNSAGRNRRDTSIRNGRHYDDHSIYQIETRYLDRASFDKEVGEAIKTGLTNATGKGV